MVETSTITVALRRGAAWAAYTGADWLAEHLLSVVKEIDAPRVAVASQEQEENKSNESTNMQEREKQTVVQGLPPEQPSCKT